MRTRELREGPMRAYRAFGILAVGLICGALLGCGEETGSKPAQPEAPKKVAKVLEVPDIGAGAAEEYTYQPAGKRDPFRPHISVIAAEVAKGAGPAGHPERAKKPLTPLEELDVIEWKLVAIVQTEGKPVAMVEDPQGRGYLIEEGTSIGKWGGKVDEVLPDRVKVIESYTSGAGPGKPQEVFLQLRSGEEEEPAKGGEAGGNQ